jgi:VWFA-related protein
MSVAQRTVCLQRWLSMSVFSWKQFRMAVVWKILGTCLLGCATTLVARAQDDWFTEYVKNSNKTDAPKKDAPSYLVDVVVIDQAGQPMNWLHPGDFELDDNKEEQKLIGFSAVDQSVMKTEDVNAPTNPPKVSIEPLEAILVLDAVNLSLPQLNLVRTQVEKYLRSNDGQMKALTRYVLFTSAGMQLQSATILNGSDLADQLEKSMMQPQAQSAVKVVLSDADRFQMSVKNLRMIVAGERKTPGHKLLFWIGPGWPIPTNSSASTKESDQASNFEAIVALANGLREARMEIFNVRISTDDAASSNAYQAYLKGVSKKDQAGAGNLALQVLSLESGGRVTIPSGDVAGEITRTVSSESVYYALRFTPSGTGKQLNYHELLVQIGQPGAVARLVTGYYEAP